MAAGGHKAAGWSWHLNAFDGNAVIFSLSIFSQGQSLIESESEKQIQPVDWKMISQWLHRSNQQVETLESDADVSAGDFGPYGHRPSGTCYLEYR